MTASMTGFGRAQQIINGREITVEIKSVNARYFEYSSRISRAFSFLDDKLKKLLNEKISRGKTELSLMVVNINAEDTIINVNTELAKQYYNALQAVAQACGVENKATAAVLAGYPDVMVPAKAAQDEEQIWQDVKTVAQDALDSFMQMRTAEGAKMKEDILARLAQVEQNVLQIEQLTAGRVQKYTDKLYARLQELLADANVEQSRLVTEAALFADKTAIDEETVRLHSHIKQYRDILEMNEPVGRKLDFLTQELNREINTIGSKAQELEITRIVVDTKSEIEKIREQIQNIE